LRKNANETHTNDNRDNIESSTTTEEAGTKGSLELEEKAPDNVEEEPDDEINRRLFMDNIAKDASDEEDDELEVIDYKIGKVKQESVTVEEASINQDDTAQEETDNSAKSLLESSKPQEEFEEEKSNSTEPAAESTKDKIELLKQSTYFQDNPKQFEECTDDKFVNYWRDAKPLTFLAGWKMKKNEIKKATGETVPVINFLSPLNIILRSGVSVIEYLRLSGESDEEVTELSKKLRIKEEKFMKYKSKYWPAEATSEN